MSATPEYDQDAMMQESISRIHEEWKELRQESSSGQKGWLTQIRNYYARLVQADLRKKGVKLSYANVEIRLSDVK
jgi:hypothetical protein